MTLSFALAGGGVAAHAEAGPDDVAVAVDDGGTASDGAPVPTADSTPEVDLPEAEQSEAAQPPEVGQPEVGQPEVDQPEVEQPEVEQPEVSQSE
ncbi:MAG: hypothetical protein LBQ92_01425, partial [Propionibacteriaceae bacterium]|nr:hypothetical protein [Propionibacteriaceae bacterium]